MTTEVLPGVPGSTETGWSPTEDGITIEEWTSQVERVQTYEGSVLWVIGDMLNFGEAHFGEEYYQGFKFHYEPSTIRRARNICAEFPPARRRKNVGIWKHEVVMAADYQVQEEVLTKADDVETGGLTAKEMAAEREKIEQGDHGKPETVEPDECPTCGAENAHWKRVPAEMSSRAGTAKRGHLKAV